MPVRVPMPVRVRVPVPTTTTRNKPNRTERVEERGAGAGGGTGTRSVNAFWERKPRILRAGEHRTVRPTKGCARAQVWKEGVQLAVGSWQLAVGSGVSGGSGFSYSNAIEEPPARRSNVTVHCRTYGMC